METKHQHAGHRQRLKEKVRKGHLSQLSSHEILELLLTYTIPRRDTNNLAHEIFNAFGSLSGSIDADYEDIKKIKGVGEESALLLKIISELIDIYTEDKKSKQNTAILNTTQKAVQYFRNHYLIKNVEYLHGFCLNKMNKVVSHFEIKGTENKIVIDIKDFADKINTKNASGLLLFHTHPDGVVEPSADDVATTQRILNICYVHGIKVMDHIVINENEYYSFRGDGKLQIAEQNCLKLMGETNSNTLSQNTRKKGKWQTRFFH